MGLFAPLVSVLGTKLAGPTVGSSLLAAGGSLLGGMMQNEANARMAQRQMDHQSYMSNTAHQRQVEDLKQAGLNPILSGLGGSGASALAGASAQMGNPLGDAVGSAQEARRLDADIDLVREQTNKTSTDIDVGKATEQQIQDNRELIGAQRKKAEAEEAESRGRTSLNDQVRKTEEMRTQSEAEQRLINRAEAVIRGNIAKGTSTEGEIDDTTAGKILRWINRGSRSLQGNAPTGGR